MNAIKIFNIVKKGDVLTMQYFTGLVEIRANMTGLTGSGILIATKNTTCLNELEKKTYTDIEELYETLINGVK